MFMLLCMGTSAAKAQLNVTMSGGSLTGIANEGVEEFLGIPYAQPPIGPLRWHAPQPFPVWDGVREAKQFGSACPQKLTYPGPNDPSRNEDCLYLNVYRPGGNIAHRPYPVMVWIHGGSNTNGSGKDYDPTQMVRQNGIIVVTINYRLGVLGWLPMPTIESPEGKASGNFGLMDQQAALAWVQKNIGFFGGDPSKVTAAGESAGAFGICANLASPRAKGLFQQAIMQSFDCHQATQSYVDELAHDVVKKVKCDGGKPEQIAACMRDVPVSVLLDAPEDLRSIDSQLTSVSFGGYLDGDLIPVQPEAAVTSGVWNKVPILLGSDRNEAAEVTFAGLKFQQLKEQGAGGNSAQQYWPLSEHTYKTIISSKFPSESAVLEEVYQGSEYSTPFDSLSSIYSDSYILGCPISPQADILAAQTTVFRYEFAVPNTPLPRLVQKSAGRFLGAYHSGELQYLFSESGYPGPGSNEQQALSERMIRYWGNFVANGDPSNDGDSEWPRYQGKSGDILSLSPAGDSVTNTFDTEHHCQLWASLLRGSTRGQ